MMWLGGDWGWGAWLAMSLMMLAFLAVAIWVFLSVTHTSSDDRRDSGEDILADRFARGEIDENEYRHRRELIRMRR